jgi:hypothetical protein
VRIDTRYHDTQLTAVRTTLLLHLPLLHHIPYPITQPRHHRVVSISGSPQNLTHRRLLGILSVLICLCTLLQQLLLKLGYLMLPRLPIRNYSTLLPHAVHLTQILVLERCTKVTIFLQQVVKLHLLPHIRPQLQPPPLSAIHRWI